MATRAPFYSYDFRCWRESSDIELTRGRFLAVAAGTAQFLNRQANGLECSKRVLHPDFVKHSAQDPIAVQIYNIAGARTLMDIQTIDQQYAQLESASQQVYQEIRDLAAKLQTEAAKGNPNAREWVLDLKETALAIQSQQQQTMNLLQAIHGYVANQNQAYTAAYPGYSQPGSLPAGSQQPQQPGGLGGFLQSGFGRAVVTGLGFGLGDDLINKIF